MPYVPVPKDLNAVKARVIGPFTKRQAFCFTLAAATGLPVYWLVRRYLSNDIAAVLLMLSVTPYFFLAMYRKNGQPFEKVVMNYIRYRFVRPRKRPYKAENLYAMLERQSRMEKEAAVFAAKKAGKARKKARTRAKPHKTGRGR